MHKRDFPSLVTDYDEMKLADWAARPRKRRSHTEQMARWSWRAIRNFVITFWVVNMTALVIMAVIHPEMTEYEESSRILGLLLALTVLISPEAPAWWIDLYRRCVW